MQYKSDLSLSNKTFSYNQPDISNNSEEIHREQWFPAAEKEAEEIAVHEAAQTQWAEEPVWVTTVLWTHNHPHGLADALLVVQYGSDYPFPIHIQWQSHHAKSGSSLHGSKAYLDGSTVKLTSPRAAFKLALPRAETAGELFLLPACHRMTVLNCNNDLLIIWSQFYSVDFCLVETRWQLARAVVQRAWSQDEMVLCAG